MAKKPNAQPNSADRSQGVDLPEIERLLGFMDKHSLEELEYERDGLHVRLKRATAHGQGSLRTVPSADVSMESAASAHGASPAAATPAAHRAGAGDAARSEDLHVIKSPIVGTYYGSPSPGAEAFVNVGARVEPGQVLCIIEAMKLMNEIESDTAGEVVRIFAENGQPVEYGESLFGIRPDRKK